MPLTPDQIQARLAQIDLVAELMAAGVGHWKAKVAATAIRDNPEVIGVFVKFFDITAKG